MKAASEEPQNGISERWQGRQSNFVSPLDRRVCDGLFQKAERSRVHTCKKYSGSRESYVTARHKRERSTRGSFGLLSKVLIWIRWRLVNWAISKATVSCDCAQEAPSLSLATRPTCSLFSSHPSPFHLRSPTDGLVLGRGSRRRRICTQTCNWWLMSWWAFLFYLFWH